MCGALLKSSRRVGTRVEQCFDRCVGCLHPQCAWSDFESGQPTSNSAHFRLKQFVVEGSLMSYGPDTADIFRRSSSYVDRILKGEPAGNLPVQSPEKFELVVNLKAAKALGLSVRESFLLLADDVIE